MSESEHPGHLGLSESCARRETKKHISMILCGYERARMNPGRRRHKTRLQFGIRIGGVRSSARSARSARSRTPKLVNSRPRRAFSGWIYEVPATTPPLPPPGAPAHSYHIGAHSKTLSPYHPLREPAGIIETQAREKHHSDRNDEASPRTPFARSPRVPPPLPNSARELPQQKPAFVNHPPARIASSPTMEANSTVTSVLANARYGGVSFPPQVDQVLDQVLDAVSSSGPWAVVFSVLALLVAYDQSKTRR